MSQSLAGTLRAALAQRAPRDIALRRDGLVDAVRDAAELDSLGIELLSLRIVSVRDEAGELARAAGDRDRSAPGGEPA